MQSNKVIIEYFGVSGVGKTTTLKKEYAQKKESGVDVNWPREELYENKGWLERNFIKALGVLQILFTKPTWSFKAFRALTRFQLGIKDFAKLFFNYLSLQFILTRSIGECLFDEGVFQIVWATYMRSPNDFSEIECSNLLELFQAPDTLYVVEAPADIIAERLKKRGTQTRILEFNDLEKKITEMIDVQENIIKTAIETNYISDNSLTRIKNY